MKEISLAEARVIQMTVLDVIHKFCVNNNINYSISCGTLIGAIRHKGYIPWDDDIDIYMLRNDYEMFIKKFPQEMDEVRVASLETDLKWDRPYANAYNIKTLKIEDANVYTIGMGLDIFPIDCVPEDDKEWKKYNKKRMLLQNIFTMKQLKLRSQRSWYKNLIVVFARIPLLLFSTRTIALYIDSYIKQYNADETNYVFESCQGISFTQRFYKADFDEYEDVLFEDRIYKAMKGYKRYLTLAYGNYMELPPVEKRKSTHAFKVYWK